MKKIFKFGIVFLFLMVLLFNFAFIPEVEAVSNSRFGRQVLAQQKDSEALLDAYDKIKDGIEFRASSISLSKTKTINADQLGEVYLAIFNDYPEYFWMNGGYEYNYTTITQAITSVEPQYYFDNNKISSAKDAFEEMSNELIYGLEGKSDYEKSLIIHDRLAERVIYKETSNDQNAYGAIVEGKAVCAGYAKAYHYLLSKVGIEAWSLSGESVNPETNKKEGHRWNMAKLDGEWYYTDVTWDDQKDVIYHNYLNRPLSYFNKTHFPDAYTEYLPAVSSDSCNYFVKNNLVFSEVDVDRIVSLYGNFGETITVYSSGDPDQFINSLADNMLDIVKKLGAQGGAKYTYYTSRQGNEIRLRIIVEPSGHVHSTSLVTGSAPTCISEGKADYYACSCGRIFYDESAEKEIESSESLILERVYHTMSGDWEKDDIAHWRYCKVCSADIKISSDYHTDDNNDLVCDICRGEVSSSVNGDSELSSGGKTVLTIVVLLFAGITVGSFIRKIFKKKR